MTDERPHEETRPASPAAHERILRFQSLGRGAIFAGRYEIREPLGSGGAGEVYRATDRTAGADVALKVLFPGSDMRDLDRLRRELRLVRALQHPGIVRIFDIGESDGLLYMVSELLEGESLADRIRREGAIPHAEAETILRRVLEGLAVAHAAGVIHRDIKPANIFLERPANDGSRRVLLLDFGLARLWGEPGLTATGRFVGTPEYCAPEQALGEKELTPATDLYACGVTLWAMLSGKPPFRGTSEITILNAHLGTPPPSPRKEMPGAPARLRAFALACLAKNPAGRPTDAAEALLMLDHPLSLRVRGRLFRALAGRMLGRKAALAAGAAFVLAAAGLLGLWLLVPVGVRHEGKKVFWETRGGWELAGPQFEQPVASIRLCGTKPGLVRQAFIGLRGQAIGDGPWRPHPPFPRMLFEVPNIWSSPKPVLLENASRTALETGFYSDFDPSYLPSTMIDLPELELGRGPRLAVEAGHALFYPTRIVGTDESGRIWFIYNHPGRLLRLESLSRGESAPLILAAGSNYLLGPRSVVAALRTGEHGSGQGPPYTGPLMQREQAEWYLFLPFDQDSDNKFHLDGDVGVVESSDLAPFRFHAATGIPVEAEDRGGLSEKDWNARRNGLLAALYEASARDQRGDPGAGARILEEFAAKGGGSPELLSIPLYRAAIERMREAARAEAPSWTSSITGPDRAASGAGGPPRPVRPGQSRTIALLAALDDIRRAASIETKPATPPLYLLLEADILIRLDRKREAQELLGAWRVGPSAQSHFFYDWMLLSWRAGADPPLKLALSGFPEEVHTGWPSLIRLAHSGHHGDLPSGRATAEELNSLQVQWDSQHYWAARLYLDVPVPDPAEALAHLDRAKESFRTGLHVPLAAARLHAQLLSNPANRPSAAQLEEARRDLAETAECAATNAVCLTLLECGERDLAAVARSGDLIAEEPTAR